MGIKKEEINAFNGKFISGFFSEMNQIPVKISRGIRKGNK